MKRFLTGEHLLGRSGVPMPRCIQSPRDRWLWWVCNWWLWRPLEWSVQWLHRKVGVFGKVRFEPQLRDMYERGLGPHPEWWPGERARKGQGPDEYVWPAHRGRK